MRKIIRIQYVIIIAALVLILPLAFLSRSSSVPESVQAINWDNASRSLTFDLKSGQTVTGWIDYAGEKHGAWFLIGAPDGSEMGFRDTVGNRGSFSFTATVDGQYFISIAYDKPGLTYFHYSYSISPAPILGINPQILIGIVIVIAIIFTLINSLFNVYLPKKKKSSNF